MPSLLTTHDYDNCTLALMDLLENMGSIKNLAYAADKWIYGHVLIPSIQAD